MVVDRWMRLDRTGYVFGNCYGVLEPLEVVKMGPWQAAHL